MVRCPAHNRRCHIPGSDEAAAGTLFLSLDIALFSSEELDAHQLDQFLRMLQLRVWRPGHALEGGYIKFRGLVGSWIASVSIDVFDLVLASIASHLYWHAAEEL